MEEKDKRAISRRQFARRAAITSAAITAGAISLTPESMLHAGIPCPAVPTDTLAHDEPQATNLAKLSAESQVEAEGRAELIFQQYRGRFSEEEKRAIQKLCVAAQPALDRLRAYPLKNGDAPALYLKPLVEREKKPGAVREP